MADSERATGGAEKPAILADACEAVIGALYRDGGLEVARAFIEKYWDDRVSGLRRAPQDPKTAAQEWAHAQGIEPPAYSIVAVEGPEHAPRFTIEARFARGAATATGGSKKEAERRAAAALLAELGEDVADG